MRPAARWHADADVARVRSSCGFGFDVARDQREQSLRIGQLAVRDFDPSRWLASAKYLQLAALERGTGHALPGQGFRAVRQAALSQRKGRERQTLAGSQARSELGQQAARDLVFDFVCQRLDVCHEMI